MTYEVNQDEQKPDFVRFAARISPFFARVVNRFLRKNNKADLSICAASKKISELDFFDCLVRLGVCAGDSIMIHSSWDKISGWGLPPLKITQVLKDSVGISGNVFMPGFPNVSVTNNCFVINRTPSNSGLLTEVFRRSKDTMRSIHTRSVLGVGSSVKDFLSDHPTSPYPSGIQSPFFKFAEYRAKILFLGVGITANTMFHCGEDVFGDAFPFQVYEKLPRSLKINSGTVGEFSLDYFQRTVKAQFLCDSARMIKYFAPIVKKQTIGGIVCKLVEADKFWNILDLLTRKKVHMFGFNFPPPEQIFV